MHRFASEFIDKKILLKHEGMIAGVVEEVIINPENGDFLGLVVRVSTKKREYLVVPEKDIQGINREYVLIKNADVLAEENEVVRIKSARDQRIQIEKNKVYTVSNYYLGRVNDYTIDLISAKLSRLYIQPTGISKLARCQIIEAKRIVSIKKNRITVDDSVASLKEKKVIKSVVVRSESN